MKLGGEYRLRNITRRNWSKQAHELTLDPDGMIERVDRLAAQLLDRLPEIARQTAKEGLAHSIIPRLTHLLTLRAKHCRRVLRARS